MFPSVVHRHGERVNCLRVLLGHFGSVFRIGLDDLLRERGYEVVAEETLDQTLVDRLVDALPDVVMLDLDCEHGPDTARAISAAFPAVKVVAFSANTQTVRVFPRFHGGESYDLTLSTADLLDTVCAT
jgi:DNA-binding NarL/FixJ family response regulator